MELAISMERFVGPQAWGLAWGLGVLLLTLVAVFLVWMLRDWRGGIARFSAQFSLLGALVFGGLLGTAVLRGGEKTGGTNGTDQTSMPTNGMDGISHPDNGASMVGAPLRLSGDMESTVPELRFTSIEPGTAGVTLGLAWTPNLLLPDGKIGIYGKLDLRDPIWSWLGVWMPPSGATSGTVFVGDEFLTGDSSVHPPMAFFKASTVADSDGDGIRDRDETGWVEQDAPLPAFDFSDAVDVVDASSVELDSGVSVVQLPFKVKLAGCFSDRVSICVDGVVGFLPTGFSSAQFGDMATNRDLSDGYLYNEDVPVVAAYWDDLFLPSGLDGRIRTLSAEVDGENWFVVEYANVRLAVERWSTHASKATIQVAVCEADPSTVYVRYLSLTGQFDGSSATLGAQGVEGTPNFPVAYNGSGSVASGDVIAYHFGCGGNPQMRDTDGDGLDDGRELEVGTSVVLSDTDGDGLLDKWELDNELDPISADGRDGGCGDADGDGLSNADEQAHGTKANRRDSDGDGLEDGEEAGGIVPVSGLPWLTFDTSEDLTTSFSSSTFSLANWHLPEDLVIRGVSVTNVVLDVNGAVYFCRAGGEVPEYSFLMCSADEIENDDVLVVAPYWSCFEIAADSALPTRIRAGKATHDGQIYLLVECEYLHGVLFCGDASVLSYQLAVPLANPDRAFVRYRIDAGDDFNGENGVVSCCGFDSTAYCAYEVAENWPIEDGLSLQFLFGLGTDPVYADSDDDDLLDSFELDNGTNPNRADTDSDGIPDGWEFEHGLDPFDPTDAALDPDGDGLNNFKEYLNDTNPSGADEDHDGVPDGYDTDGDGVDDGTEVENGSDPNDPLDLGFPPSLDECRLIDFGIAGDYAAWEMKIEGLGPYDWRTMRLSMSEPGWSVTSGMKLLYKGNTYRLTMRWLNSDGHEDERAPWYCWEAQIDGLPLEQTFDDYSNTRKPGVAEVVIGNGWIAENASGLLTSHVHECTRKFDGSSGGGNVARGKEVLFHVIDVVVDEIRFNRDRTTCTADGINLIKKYGKDQEIGVNEGEWSHGGLVNDPVCYVAGITPVVDVKFRVYPEIVTGIRIGATAEDPQGVLGDLAQQTCFVSAGDSQVCSFTSSHVVPGYVDKFEHKWEWRVTSVSVGAVQANVDFVCFESGSHRVYTIIDEPGVPWEANGSLWPIASRVDVLDFAVDIGRAASNESAVLYLITDYLFNQMGYSYETKEGRSLYWDDKRHMFNLTGYISRSEPVVNCVDQAYAVTLIGNLLGARARVMMVHPFGYIRTLDLVGIGPCNNPCFMTKPNAVRYALDEGSGNLVLQNVLVPQTSLCDGDDIARTPFDLHAFVVSEIGNVYDACLGPALGSLTVSEYLEDVIDYSTTLEVLHSYFSPYARDRYQSFSSYFIAR